MPNSGMGPIKRTPPALMASSSSSNFSAALETWRGINLSELQKKLDGQGIEIVDNQKEGLLGRKALADKTKGL